MTSSKFLPVMRSFLAALALSFASSCTPAENTADTIGQSWSEAQWNHWRYLREELEILELHQQLSQQHQPEDFVIRNVTLIDMRSPAKREGHFVHVANGKITAIGPDSEIDIPEGLRVIDGSGKFLLPGLTDMHVHNLESHSQHLLNIAHGVTTVRDLDGFPFLLAMRDAIVNDTLLAPTMYVSGTILNGSDFGGYAVKINTEEEARKAVREQQALGYDFIKTHNSLSAGIFHAITDEAKKQEIDVVGHIPVDVSVAEAVASGMRVFEHFKGYINDNTLTLTDEDYITATRGADIWNTPTFATYRNHLRGDDAAQILANESEMQFVSPLLRKKWQSFADETPDAVTKLRQNIFPMSVGIFTDLRSIDGARFLAGTDSGSYEMMPPGIVLLDELSIFERLGMSPFEALETATVNAAAAMRRDGDFGIIAVGARADLLLLTHDPLQSTENLNNPEGVAIRGVWMGRSDLDGMLDGLRAAYARSAQRMTETRATTDELDDMFARIKKLHETNFPFRDHHLDLTASLYTSLNRQEAVAELTAMKVDPAFGFDFYKFE